MWWIFRLLFFPLSLLYGAVIYIRNKLYDHKILPSQKHKELTTLVVGNLAVGGTGKSPMVEYLIRLLSSKYQISILSRGYGRRTKGFLFVTEDAQAHDVGDEPLQIKKKHPDISVAVCEDRNKGVEKLKEKAEIILLDDAFQHRKLNPDFSLLLFEFNSLLSRPFLLPTGSFRDCMNQSKRADLIIITKSPQNIDLKQRNTIEKRIRKYSKAPLFYSSIKYANPISKNGQTVDTNFLKKQNVLLVTGIANPTPLLDYMKEITQNVTHLSYRDHHIFSKNDYQKISESFKKLEGDKLILTTEKDYVRMSQDELKDYPLYYIPITTEMEESELFDRLILSEIRNHHLSLM